MVKRKRNKGNKTKRQQNDENDKNQNDTDYDSNDDIDFINKQKGPDKNIDKSEIKDIQSNNVWDRFGWSSVAIDKSDFHTCDDAMMYSFEEIPGDSFEMIQDASGGKRFVMKDNNKRNIIPRSIDRKIKKKGFNIGILYELVLHRA